MNAASSVVLEPWTDDDLPLLRLLNAPEMKLHLGGPETEAKLLERQQKYAAMPASHGRVFAILGPGGERMGSVLYWDRTWRDSDVFEIGWALLPQYQGRGVATAAVVLALERAREDGRHRSVHAFPNVHNAASNAVCSRAHFVLLGEVDLEYPKGNPVRCNDWRYDLGTSADTDRR